jgi:hypothetical protein
MNNLNKTNIEKLIMRIHMYYTIYLIIQFVHRVVYYNV